ncbi:MAG: 3'(2'),5'-bisphosphate nucleotidase CysQ [Bacilli bacterium]
MPYKYYSQFEVARRAIFKASKAVLEIYKTPDFGVQMKSDHSPVTKADLLSNKIIVDYLKETYPDYGYLSEEFADDLSRLNKDFVWIIDPIDGTKDFIKRNDQFAINIALAYKGEIVLGLIMVPAKHELYYAFKGTHAYLELNNEVIQIHTSKRRKNLIAIESNEHYTDLDKDYLEKHNIKEIKRCGSAYKGCLIARGVADLQIKIGGSSKEWDIAPIDIIVTTAGGSFTRPNGERYTYNKKDVYNHSGYLIMNRNHAGMWLK